MSKLDDAIQHALTDEDRDFLAQFEKEPNSLVQMASVFSGPLAWIYIAFIVAAVILAPFGIFAAFEFFNATEMRPLFYWGFGVTAILLVLSVVRLVFFMQINTNRVLRELKRLELQIARLAVHGGK
jgi:uncharacterized membrane protein